MAVWVLRIEKAITMTAIFLLNATTPLIQELFPLLNEMPDVRIHPIILPEADTAVLNEFETGNNVFLISTPFFDEFTDFNPGYAAFLLEYLNSLVAWIQQMVRLLAQQGKPGTFIFFTTNPNVRGFLKYPISPILDESLHAFLKTLSKELHSLNFHFYALCLEPLQCLVKDPIQVRTYRKKMAAHAMSKMPLKVDGINSIIRSICEGNLSLVSGSVLPVGYGSVLGY